MSIAQAHSFYLMVVETLTPLHAAKLLQALAKIVK
jgi:hypothetical protein